MDDIVFDTTTLQDVTPSESATLKKYLMDAIVDDKRMVGFARYVINVRIFWSTQIETACAGHGFIFFNPNFYDRIPAETRITIMAHEIWHLILKHLNRLTDANPYFSNIAQDHVINIGLFKDGFTFDGTSPYMDMKYDGMSSETVYNLIYVDRKENNQGPTLDEMIKQISAEIIEGLVEKVLELDGKGVSLEKQIKDAEKAVDSFHKNPGKQAGSVNITLECTKTQVVIEEASYEDIFAAYLVDPISNKKRTFMRPSRRQPRSQTKLRLPGKMRKQTLENRLTHLVYALDVSGSITRTQAQQFHDSVRTIKTLLNPTSLTVMFFDTQVRHVQTFTEHQKYEEIRVTAGGGTCLKGVWNRVQVIQPEALVIFTDLCLTIPKKPSWECIWLIPEDEYVRVPTNLYGEIYRIPKQGKSP